MRKNRENESNETSRPLKTERERKRLISYKELSHRIILLALCLWLAMAGGLTWAVASDVRFQIQYELLDYLEGYSHKRNQVSKEYKEAPGVEYASMIIQSTRPYMGMRIQRTLPIMLKQMPSSIGSDDWYWGKWDMLYGFEAASFFYEHEGDQKKLILESGNHFSFTYTVQNEQGERETRVGYVDMDQVEGGAEVFAPWLGLESSRSPMNFMIAFWPEISMTGYFEGDQFFPYEFSYLYERAIGGYSWNKLFSMEPPADRKLQTVRGECLSATLVDYDTFTIDGIQYSGLPEFVAGMQEYPGNRNIYREGNLWNTVFISTRNNYEDESGTFDLVVAIRCWPLPYTMLRMIPFYVVTFALVTAVVVLILRRIREKLTRPLELMVAAVEAGTPAIPSAEWKEPRVLQQYISDSHYEIVNLKNEVQRLNTALDYAKSAEEHRKQLISNITHELKTPLAVIHSYAEAVQEGIDAEKKEYYLSVILEETEKMDAMVLQMLELSRLEAGKIKLSSETFSLTELARSMTERFSPMLEEKQLELSWEVKDEVSVIADENRIAQVITNLVSNACKYTPVGGKIHIWIYREGRKVYFRIENTAKHLSEQALEKVWDSFYREDPSRTEPGTGLGLTLVKNIVELHGGSVFVRNLECSSVDRESTAVEFSFMLPS
ncbi:MAG: HAMP domain-containing histidine kinase [Lachnospiraceae bacterium]|nr:HAMP domain-containing histidine kinase [Lachnospiraceae bacterium]